MKVRLRYSFGLFGEGTFSMRGMGMMRLGGSADGRLSGLIRRERQNSRQISGMGVYLRWAVPSGSRGQQPLFRSAVIQFMPVVLGLTPPAWTLGMTRSTVAASVLMFGMPFLLLAACYAALPVEVPVLRNPVAGAVFLAPKSLFTVFRVPLMNLTHGLMAAVMLSRSGDFEDAKRRASYSGIFLALLLAVALKSDFEALEMGGLAWSFGPVVPWLTRGTVVSVVGGLCLAFVHARGVPIPWPELRLSRLQKTILACLFAAYLAMVTATLLVSRRG